MKKYPKYKDSGVSWIGEIPEHWEIIKLKYLCSYFQAGKNLTSIQILPQGTYAVYGGNGIRGYFEDYNWDGTCNIVGRQGALCGNVHYVKGKIWATEHAVISKANDKTSDEYLFYLMSGMNLNQYVSQTAAQPGLSVLTIVNVHTCIPSISEQQAIVSYLDKKSAQIDSFIASTEAEIEALKELKQAEIARLVTRGVNPDVPMKDSGIAWIGEIPEHWEVRRIKWLFKEEDTRNIDLKYELLSFSRSKGIVPFSEINEKEPSANDLSKYKVIKPGQLLENRMQAWSGMFGCSHIEGCVSPDYAVFSAANDEVNVEYYATLFRTKLYIQQFANASRGVGDGFNRLYTPAFGAIYAHFPPAEEQQAIVDEINFRSSKIDLMVSKLNDQISHLKELKQRIISDAVTGKIDVSLSPALPSREGGKRANL